MGLAMSLLALSLGGCNTLGTLASQISETPLPPRVAAKLYGVCPASLRIGAQKDNAYTMHIEGQPGAQWKLQKTANLAANDWADIDTGTLDSDGLANPSITPSTDTKVFYRAIVTLDPE